MGAASEEDCGTAGAVLLSWIFSGLGILQFSVYVVFCNKGVILLSTSLVARSNKMRLYCVVR